MRTIQSIYISHELHNRGLRRLGERGRGGDPLKAGNCAVVKPDEKHQYYNKGEVPFRMIYGVPKEFE